jgi:predicted DsbA family dithiol-disulfide isomerase
MPSVRSAGSQGSRMSAGTIPELWVWAEYYWPWCYIAAVRLHRIHGEYEGRVNLRLRFFPLEVPRGERVPRDVLEQEWWLAALQEPAAPFAPYPGGDWPTTTLPAFDAVWAASRQGAAAGMAFDLRVRRAFFGEGRNIGRREVLLDLARQAGFDVPRFERDAASPAARAAVLEESRIGLEQYHVRSTPTLMLPDGTRLMLPTALPVIRNRKIVAVRPLPCSGEACLDATRALFDRALERRGPALEERRAPGAPDQAVEATW